MNNADNKIGDVGTISVSECLPFIRVLEHGYNRATHIGMLKIAKALRKKAVLTETINFTGT
jgi:hypothetical protein